MDDSAGKLREPICNDGELSRNCPKKAPPSSRRRKTLARTGVAMFRPAARSILRRQVLSAPRIAPPSSSRNLFGSAAKPRRSPFKSALLRWGAAGAVVYYYATSSAFADEPKFYAEHPTPIPSEQDERPPSVLPESAQSGRRTRAIHTDAEDDRLVPASEAGVASKGPGREETTSSRREAMSQDTRANMSGSALGEDTSARDLEEEAGQEGAFNPETGEINWDCPCLGGMAHGPCGPEFREAFSCFVHSTADPKGVDCIEKFKEMQICFQKHPEVYGSELDEDEEEIDSKLEVLDPKNPEETRSPATSSKAPTSTHIDPERAKPDTEPTGTGSEEDAVKGAQHGIDSDQTKRS